MKIVVSGTDTDVGKTIFAAALAGALGAHYWKPVQAGLEPPTDRETVARLSGLSDDHILDEAYRLSTPCSPHRAARIDGIAIDTDALIPPEQDPLVIEGAGGLLVPATDDHLFIHIFARWKLPLILVARTSLGTINHSLLSIEALRASRIPILGVAFVGDPAEDSEDAICRFGRVKRLGRLPLLPSLEPQSLALAFHQGFRVEDFQ